jgi:hypothetical protein
VKRNQNRSRKRSPKAKRATQRGAMTGQHTPAMPGVPGTSQPQRGTARSKPTPGPRDATRHCAFEVRLATSAGAAPAGRLRPASPQADRAVSFSRVSISVRRSGASCIRSPLQQRLILAERSQQRRRQIGGQRWIARPRADRSEPAKPFEVRGVDGTLPVAGTGQVDRGESFAKIGSGDADLRGSDRGSPTTQPTLRGRSLPS